MNPQTQSKRNHERRIIEAVERAQTNDETDIGGGVPLDVIAADDAVTIAEFTVRNYARELVREGDLDYQWGLPEDRLSHPRCGFVLPDQEAEQ